MCTKTEQNENIWRTKMSKLRRPLGNEALQELHRLPRVSVQELNIAAQFLLTASSLVSRGAEEACIRREVRHAIFILKQAGF